MKALRKDFKRFIASFMVLMMIISLVPLKPLADSGDKGVKIWLRIEGDDKTLVELAEFHVEAKDISYVDGLEDLDAEKPLLIHAIVMALENVGIDVKDPNVFSAQGGFIGGIGDYSSETGGWMYLINGEMATSGVTEYELKENDIIDLYYVSDWTNYSIGKLEASKEMVNVGEEITFTFTAKKEEWGVDHEYEPVENGIITLGDRKYKTDENGQVKVTLEEAGTYTVLADKQLEKGNIVRPRPLTIEVKEEIKEENRIFVEEAIEHSIDWLIKNNEVNEWVVLELARANREIPKESLLDFKKEIEKNKGDFRLITDYAKYTLVASSLGLDGRNLFGFNLVEKIYNHEDVFLQGNNGGAFALLALDSKNYPIPQDAKWTRDRIINKLLESQNEDGGFSLLDGWDSDVDMTAIALQALSNYTNREEVKEAVNKALNYLSLNQDKGGGYLSIWDNVVSESSETIAQVIVALTSLDIDPVNDERFIKDNNLVEKLLSFQLENGGFEHNIGEGVSSISTEQALRGLVAYNRFINNEIKFFNMTDAKIIEIPEKEIKIDFVDLDKASNWAKEYIIKAGKLGLIQGKGNNIFDPQGDLTRAEFATLLVNLLNIEDNIDGQEVFLDVKPGAWYYEAVMKAYKAGIVKGDGVKYFPNNPITREEMAVMLTRALNLSTEEKHNIKDMDTASLWAREAINVMYELGIMEGYNNLFRPKDKVTREMAATIIIRVYELD